MSYSYTTTETTTFTRTHARHLASKVAADLRQVQLFYSWPSDADITNYQVELVELLASSVLDSVEYGLRRNGGWLVALSYKVNRAGTLTDERAGRVRPGVDVSGATGYSYLRYSPGWYRLTTIEQARILTPIPFRRQSAAEPGLGSGAWVEDKSYAAGGTALVRRSFRS